MLEFVINFADRNQLTQARRRLDEVAIGAAPNYRLEHRPARHHGSEILFKLMRSVEHARPYPWRCGLDRFKRRPSPKRCGQRAHPIVFEREHARRFARARDGKSASDTRPPDSALANDD